jgi:glutathione-regulated potassium-efflux system ancillary protein KefG
METSHLPVMLNKILVIFAHPLLEKSRINRVLLRRYSKHENITFHDLYEAYPDFNVDVKFEKELLLNHEIIIFHHPVYWYSCPPLLKQWIDLVLEAGWAYGPGGDALSGKKLLQIVTTGGPKFSYSEEGSNRHTLREYLLPFEQTARLCKMAYFPPFVIHGTHRLSNAEITEYSNQLGGLIGYISLKDFDREDLSGYQYFNDILFKGDNHEQ